MKLERLYEMAHEEAELARAAYHMADWDAHRAVIQRRNAIIDAIFVHPKNIYAYVAIMCRVIPGLSGSEHKLKAA